MYGQRSEWELGRAVDDKLRLIRLVEEPRGEHAAYGALGGCSGVHARLFSLCHFTEGRRADHGIDDCAEGHSSSQHHSHSLNDDHDYLTG